jgi:hypothetical protein
MTEQTKAHPEEEILERFAMDQLNGPELDRFEDHLLLCAHCQERLDEVTGYVAVMREAAENVAAEAPVESVWRRWLRLDWLPMPAPALAGAFVVLIAVLAWQPWRATAPSEWRTVELATLRGGAAGSVGTEGFSLHLRLDVDGLDTAGAAAQIVTANGKTIAEVPAPVAEGKAELRYAPGLEAGQYWVRLKKSGETLREYSLVVAKP